MVASKNEFPVEKTQESDFKEFSDAVGDFIRYWGFRRIHGQLWTQIYLSKIPLSGVQLMRKLGVSKALVSPGLSELVKLKLIFAEQADGRTKTYTANPDVFGVIREVLKTREQHLITKAQKSFDELNQRIASSGSNYGIEESRLKSVGEMIAAATVAIDLVIKSADCDAATHWLSLEQTVAE